MEESKYMTEEEKQEIREMMEQGKSNEEIIEVMKEKSEVFRKLRKSTLGMILGGMRGTLKNKERAMVIKEKKEKGIEKREEELYNQIFENVEKIEEIKKKALAMIENKAEKIRPKDIKDLSVVQAIGLEKLREYKIKRAGKLGELSDEQLGLLKKEVISYLYELKKMYDKKKEEQNEKEVIEVNNVEVVKCFEMDKEAGTGAEA